MITSELTTETITEYKNNWIQYKDKLKPNRKTGTELLYYLQNKYILTEIKEENVAKAVYENVIMNECYAEKIPVGEEPIPKTFYLENAGEGKQFYHLENKDPIEIWGEDMTRIFVGIDLTTGFYIVEGSTMLWDELCAFRGLDEKDLQNYVCVAEYINSLKRFQLLETILTE